MNRLVETHNSTQLKNEHFEQNTNNFYNRFSLQQPVNTIKNLTITEEWGPGYILVTKDGLKILHSDGTKGKPFYIILCPVNNDSLTIDE